MPKREVIWRWEYRELEDLIGQHFGFKKDEFGRHLYSIPAVEEARNCDTICRKVTNEPLDEEEDIDDIEDLEEIKKGKAAPFSLGIVMNELCRAGKIEAGEHVIDVFW